MKKQKFSKDRIIEAAVVNNQKSFFNKKFGLIAVGILVLLMIISIFAVGLGSDNTDPADTKAEYNGFKFIRGSGIWLTTINNQRYYFELTPNELVDITSIDLSNESFGSKVYIAFNPEEFSETSLELLRLKEFMLARGMPAYLACIKEEGCGNIPIVDCNNINKVVYLTNGNKTEIYRDNSCMVLESKIGEEPLVINRFMYGVLGVM